MRTIPEHIEAIRLFRAEVKTPPKGMSEQFARLQYQTQCMTFIEAHIDEIAALAQRRDVVDTTDPQDVSVISVPRVIEGLQVGLNTPLHTVGLRNMVGVEPESVRLAIKLLASGRTITRIGPDTPDNSMVICPQCTSQFVAISVNDQKQRREAEERLQRCRTVMEANDPGNAREIFGDVSQMPTKKCPQCKDEQPDMDGFGTLYCEKCKYCNHASITDGICGFCNQKVRP